MKSPYIYEFSDMHCKHCNKRLKAKTLVAHAAKCPKAKGKCPVCDYAGDDLANHIKEQHTPFQCFACDAPFATQKQLLTHGHNVHGVPHKVTSECLQKKEEYQCQGCTLTRLSGEDYFQHWAQFHSETHDKDLDKYKRDGKFCVS